MHNDVPLYRHSSCHRQPTHLPPRRASSQAHVSRSSVDNSQRPVFDWLTQAREVYASTLPTAHATSPLPTVTRQLFMALITRPAPMQCGPIMHHHNPNFSAIDNPQLSYCDFTTWNLCAAHHLRFDRKWTLTIPRPAWTTIAPSNFSTICGWVILTVLFPIWALPAILDLTVSGFFTTVQPLHSHKTPTYQISAKLGNIWLSHRRYNKFSWPTFPGPQPSNS